MARLRERLAVDSADVSYFEMTDRAHNSVWSGRMWARAQALAGGAGHCVFLQDDDIVPSCFVAGLRAILAVASDQLIGLHLHHPGAVAAHSAGERFVTTMSCVGIGYVLPAFLLTDFLRWRGELSADLIYRTSEDNLLDAWVVQRRRRVWHPVPTLVRPDERLFSTGGGGERFDVADQYHRKTVLGWERFEPAQLVDPAWWRAGLRQPPRNLVFAGIARPGVSMTAMPAGFDGQLRRGGATLGVR